MSTSYTFELPYPPLSGNRASRTGRGRHYTPKELVAYRQRLAIEASRQGVAGLMLAGPLVFRVQLMPPDLRARDEDNALKVLKDAMTRARIWVDDSNRVIRRTGVEWCDVVSGGLVCVTLTGLESAKLEK